jgi:large subunit ribosomal protein L29
MTTIKELRGKENKELVKLLTGARSKLVGLRASRTTGSLPNGSELRKERREIARILTVLKEQEILDKVKKSVKEK